MKTEDFKKIIRTIVQDELKNQLPSMIPKILSEVLTNKNDNSTTKLEEQPVNNHKEYKQYVKNPKLNEVLNQTIVKIKNDNSQLVEYSDKLSSETNNKINIQDLDSEKNINFKDLNEDYSPAKPIVANIQPVSEEQAKVLGKLNRDFRGLMRSIDEKRKNGNSMLGTSKISMDS